MFECACVIALTRSRFNHEENQDAKKPERQLFSLTSTF